LVEAPAADAVSGGDAAAMILADAHLLVGRAKGVAVVRERDLA